MVSLKAQKYKSAFEKFKLLDQSELELGFLDQSKCLKMVGPVFEFFDEYKTYVCTIPALAPWVSKVSKGLCLNFCLEHCDCNHLIPACCILNFLL